MKRFIDTNIFSDEWFSDLSKEGKLFFIYFITNCDHAGILRLNKKLCEFQLKIDSSDTVIKELGKSIVTLKENLFFLPKFLKFQYPDFPKSKVRQQEGALKILNSLGISLEKINSYLTVNKELPNSYVSDTVIGNETENDRGVRGELPARYFLELTIFPTICKFWDFEDEQNFLMQHQLIELALRKLYAKNELENFTIQTEYYIKCTPEKKWRMSLENYLTDGWRKENWKEKFKAIDINKPSTTQTSFVIRNT